jgi:hypothetical protein
VIGVFDDESVVLTGDEIYEDFVALQRTLVGRVHRYGAVLFSPGRGPENRSNQPGLAHSGRPQQDQNGLGCGQVTLDELLDGAAQLRICLVHDDLVGDLIKGSVQQRAAAIAELPLSTTNIGSRTRQGTTVRSSVMRV